MNKLTIPSILAATVLIAGIFAFMPVEKASTVHTDLEEKIEEVENAIKGEIEISKNRFFLETVNLGGLTDDSTIVVADTYPHGMGQVHIAATLPVADVGADGCDDQEPLVDVKAGKASNLDIVLTGAHNMGIDGREDFAGDEVNPFASSADMCVFDRTITVANVNADMLTSIVVEGMVGTLPADAFITVSGMGLMVDGIVIPIGLLYPETGGFASFGKENLAGTRLGVADFNKHLESEGSPWILRIAEKDTATDPDTALAKLRELDAKGIEIVLGPGSSRSVEAVREYANSNDILLVSAGSTAPALAISGDNVFRLVPDDNKQGAALAELIHSEGFRELVPVWRDDLWGNGLKDVVTESFDAKTGTTVADGFSYNPDTLDAPRVTEVINDLSSIVESLVNSNSADEVAVLFIGYEEVVLFLDEALDNQTLEGVGWFGSDANTKQQYLTGDSTSSEFADNIEDASEFADLVEFTSLQFAASKSAKYESVKSDFGNDPGIYAYASYDAVWVIGLTMLDTQSTDALTIKEKLPEIAEEYSGAIGSTRLNAAGDLAEADYEVWGVVNDEWILLGNYIASTGQVVPT